MSATPGTDDYSFLHFIKRIVRLVCSCVYFAGLCVWRLTTALLGRRRRSGLIVLYYHSVPDLYTRNFRDQMRELARLSVVSLGKLSPTNLDSSVAVTFDDALSTFARNALPVLKKFRIPATLFVVSGALGQKPIWGESYFSEDEKVMTQEQIQRLPSLIEIGSHTVTHVDLSRLEANALTREVSESKLQLERFLGQPVTLLSLPFGRSSDEAIHAARAAGYEHVFTVEPECLLENRFVMGRVSVDPWDWKMEFWLKVRGAYCWRAESIPLLGKLLMGAQLLQRKNVLEA